MDLEEKTEVDVAQRRFENVNPNIVVEKFFNFFPCLKFANFSIESLPGESHRLSTQIQSRCSLQFNTECGFLGLNFKIIAWLMFRIILFYGNFGTIFAS